jgi:hypothetical protein
MSVKATTWAWYESKAAGTDLLVLLALADFADETGRCFGSWATMQKKTKLGRSTIARCIKRLEASGELTAIEGAKTLNGRNLATVWQLPVEGGCQTGTGPALTLPPSRSDTTPGPALTLPPSRSDTPTYKNVKRTEKNKSAAAPASATASPSLPISEKAAPKPKKAPAAKFDPATLPLPHGPGLARAWQRFIQHRREIGHRLTPLASTDIIADLAKVNEAAGVEAINKSIKNGWRGVFVDPPATAPKLVTLPPQGQPKQTALERSLAEMRQKYGKEHAA